MVTALKAGRFCRGLDDETLLDDKKFEAAMEAAEEHYNNDTYWDGWPQVCRWWEIEERGLVPAAHHNPEA
jgi:hypothetical protein